MVAGGGGGVVMEYQGFGKAMDHQQGPIIQHKELYSSLCASLDRRGIGERMDKGICMAESLHSSPEDHNMVNRL